MLNKGVISMNIGLALIPSKSFQDEVNGYRKRYDTEYARIMLILRSNHTLKSMMMN